MKYALHNEKIAFVLKRIDDKQQQAIVDVRTNPSGDSSLWRRNVLASLFGAALSREILEFDCEEPNVGFKCTGLVSHPNYVGRKSVLILFINDRLVECSALKKGQLFFEPAPD